MTRFELKQLVCNTLNVISYRIGLQYRGKNHVSEQVMDMLDCYNNDEVLSEREVDVVDEWLSTYEASHQESARTQAVESAFFRVFNL